MESLSYKQQRITFRRLRTTNQYDLNRVCNASLNEFNTQEQQYRNIFHGLYREATLSYVALPDWKYFSSYKQCVKYLDRFIFSYLLKAEQMYQKIHNNVLITEDMIIANELIAWCYFLTEKDTSNCIKNLKIRQIYIKMHEESLDFDSASQLSLERDPFSADIDHNHYNSSMMTVGVHLAFTLEIVEKYCSTKYGTAMLHEMKRILKYCNESEFVEYFGDNWKKKRFELFCKCVQWRQMHEKRHYWSRRYILPEHNFVHSILSKEKESPQYIAWKNVTRRKQCEHCYKKDTTLKKCKKCKKTYYCSAKCQKLDWKKKHHNECGKQNNVNAPVSAYLLLKLT